MKFLRALICCIIGTLAIGSHAIVCEPGGAPAALADMRDATSVALTGTIDASDLFFLADSLPALSTLDLSGVAIAPYHGKKLRGTTVYPAATIPAGAFGGSKLTGITLPQGINIGDMAFASSTLRSIVIPDNVSLGSGAFADCRSLTEASIAASALTGDYIFRDCTALAKVNLGGSVKVPAGTFAGCSSLSGLTGAQSLTAIGKEAFFGTSSLEQLPDAPLLKTIGAFAFSHSGLKSLRLANGVDAIGEGAFFGCMALTDVTLPATLAKLSDYLFANTPLAYIRIPENLDSIGRYALKDTEISVVVLPETLTAVGDGAMEGAKSLTAIDVHALGSVPSTGADVWAGIDVAKVKLYVGDGTAGFADAPQWQDFDIVAGESSVDSPAVASALHVRYADGVLTLVSDGPDISEVLIFKVSGTLEASFHPASPGCVADLSHIDKGTIIVVAATLADGTRSTIKIAL